MKLEVSFLPFNRKRNLKLNCTSNWGIFQICTNGYSQYSGKYFSPILKTTNQDQNPHCQAKKNVFIVLTFSTKVGFDPLTCREILGSSEVNTHKIGKNREVQKSLFTGTGRTGKFVKLRFKYIYCHANAMSTVVQHWPANIQCSLESCY